MLNNLSDKEIADLQKTSDRKKAATAAARAHPPGRPRAGDGSLQAGQGAASAAAALFDAIDTSKAADAGIHGAMLSPSSRP